MLVKKIDPTWMPKENESLQVGETIEITDPYVLIKQGKVVPANEEEERKLTGDSDLKNIILERKLKEMEAKLYEAENKRHNAKRETGGAIAGGKSTQTADVS